MYTVYILYSSKFRKKYIGYTSNLIERFKPHNYLATKGYTMRYRPRVVIHTEVFETIEQALKREKHIIIFNLPFQKLLLVKRLLQTL